MKIARRSTTLALAGLLAVGALSTTACSSAQDQAKAAVSGAVSSAAAAALDAAQTQQVDEVLSDGTIKSKVCEQVKSNADQAYETVISAINSKKAGAGDALKSAVSVDTFKSFIQTKCA